VRVTRRKFLQAASATALLAAIDHQRRTGQGQHLDVSQFEASLHFLVPALLTHALDGAVATRNGNRAEHAAPHGVYPCAGDEADADRWIAVSVRDTTAWRAFCTVLGRREWIDDPRFATHADRIGAADTLDGLIADATRREDARALMDRLQAAGVAAGVVQSALDLHTDPVLAGWGFFEWLEHPERPPAPYEGHALRLEGTPGRLRCAAKIGQTESQTYRRIPRRRPAPLRPKMTRNPNVSASQPPSSGPTTALTNTTV